MTWNACDGFTLTIKEVQSHTSVEKATQKVDALLGKGHDSASIRYGSVEPSQLQVSLAIVEWKYQGE